MPARNEVRDSAEFTALSGQAALAEQIDDLFFPPAVPGIADAFGEYEKGLNEITLGLKDVASVLNASAERATKVLEANAKKYGA